MNDKQRPPKRQLRSLTIIFPITISKVPASREEVSGIEFRSLAFGGQGLGFFWEGISTWGPTRCELRKDQTSGFRV